MTSYRTKEEVGAGLYKVFPYESLCCNGDYCDANCDLKRRNEVTDFISQLRLSDLESIIEEVEKIKATVEEVNGTSKYDSCYDDVLSYLKSLKQ